MIKNSTIHPSVKIWHTDQVNIYDSKIDEGCTIGAFVEINGATIGKRCKIHPFVYVCEGVTIGDDVFISQGVKFTNDKYPKVKGEWDVMETVVEDGVSIGANATILPVVLGKYCVIGAGSVVTKDTEAHGVYVGNPARKIGDVRLVEG